MALVISSAALKGGVGKTCLSLNLASYLHSAKQKSLVVDLDPQRTASYWAGVAAESNIDGPPVVGLEGPSLRRDLPRISTGFDAVLIDTPPRLGKETRAAMLVSDIVVIPVVPGPESIWALGETLELLSEAKSLRPEIKAAAFLNRADRTQLAQATRDALINAEVPLLEASLGSRVAFGEAIAKGRGVVDYAPQSAAAKEVEALAHAIMEILK